MLSPHSFSLFCVFLICLPFALFFFTLSPHSSSYFTTLSFTYHHVTTTLISPPPPSQPPPSPKLNVNRQSSVRPFSNKTLPKTPTPTKINSTLPKHPLPTPLPPPPPPPKLSISPIQIISTSPPPPKLILRNQSSVKLSYTETLSNKQTRTQINSTLPKLPLPIPPPPPPPPEDDKDDVELLKRASWVNPNPIKGPKKLAFLFLTTSPLPFSPLWEKFFNKTETQDRYNIYIHYSDPNPTQNNIPSSIFTGIFHDRVIPSSKPTARNTPTLVAAARRLLAHALLDDPNNYMFTLLSPACIPLHSFNFTYKTLTSSNKSFIEILSNETTAYSRWAARGEQVMLPDLPLDVFRIGSQFWTLARRHALVVVKDVNLWRKFRVPCIYIGVCFPEENYFPTLLSMVDPQNVVPATLTNVDWNGGSNGHPRVYNETEVGVELIQRLRMVRPRYGETGFDVGNRCDPFLFARKFEPTCVHVLLSLANHVLFKD